ncbi:glycoside hydrolase family 3 protein [Microlunatus soli]|uniref:beta-N-acetylhexosaminidase n=1 Tax=Microlunatus soli TaxID=630515 RepID=A0A1H1QAP4_9ACTN|nr:glycoside hydrolase family 3 protein [Microlunatus soli]SDS19949.1 beta-N-acetylhexosaminidase [Microlunatus soli]
MTGDVLGQSVEPLLAAMSLPDKIGQLITHLVYGASADEPDDRNTDLFGVATPAEVVAKYRLGGVIYFAWAGNTADPQQIGRLSNGLQQAAGRAGLPGLIIGTDQETGRVARMGPPATQFPGAMALAATHDAGAVRVAYRITGAELAAVGVNTCFAPVADVNIDQANPVIGIRSFSSEPDVVAEYVRAAIAGLQRDAGPELGSPSPGDSEARVGSGLAAAAKHFPGHGDTSTDSHHALPTVTHSAADWEAVDALPFAEAVRAGVEMIMTGHLAFPAIDPSGDPATLSSPILTGLLRDRLGYTGVIITDSLRMQGVRELHDDGEIAVRAIEAGVDILLEPADPDAAVAAITDALASGRLTEQRIDASVRRILQLKQRRGLLRPVATSPNRIAAVVGSDDHQREARAITAASITLIRDDGDLIPLRRAPVCLLGADEAAVHRVAAGLQTAGLEVSGLVTGPRPDRDMINAARACAHPAAQTVIITSAAWLSRWQRTMVRAVREVTGRVVLVAITDPYDAGLVTAGGTMLLSYSATPIALDAVVDVLLGTSRPVGRLPVTVGENRDHPLFPYRAGIVRG